MTVRYSGPGGTCNSLVSDLVVSAPVLQFTHAGGQIGMWNHDSGILSDNNGDVTYTLRFYQDIDTDGDGIPDWLEVAGWWDGFGNQHFTDPNSADGDGIDKISDMSRNGHYPEAAIPDEMEKAMSFHPCPTCRWVSATSGWRA